MNWIFIRISISQAYLNLANFKVLKFRTWLIYITESNRKNDSMFRLPFWIIANNAKDKLLLMDLFRQLKKTRRWKKGCPVITSNIWNFLWCTWEKFHQGWLGSRFTNQFTEMRLSWMLEFSTVEISAFRFIDTSTTDLPN